MFYELNNVVVTVVIFSEKKKISSLPFHHLILVWRTTGSSKLCGGKYTTTETK